MKTVEVLRKARELIEKPEHWGKQWFYDDGRYCADGACRAAATGKPEGENDASAAAVWLLKQAVGSPVWAWNDYGARSHAEILAGFDKAIAIAALAEQEAVS